MHSKKKKLIPFAFLGGLLIIAIFIIGVQYGRHVAQLDKTIHFLISITPTKAVTPTPGKAIEYTTYQNTGCGIAFIYPDSLTVTTEASFSALLTGNEKETLEFTCAKDGSLKSSFTAETATEAAVLIQGKELEASASGDIYSFYVLNLKKQLVQFHISSALLPLIEKTLQLTK